MGLVVEAVCKEFRDCDGIFINYRTLAQWFSNKEPGKVGSNDKSNGCPEGFFKTTEVAESGKSHQNPGRGV